MAPYLGLNELEEQVHINQKSISKPAGSEGTSIKSQHDFVLRIFRCLIADLCQQFGGGHPGGAMGMAAIGVALFKYAMRYAPSSPSWFNRDRFLLSNGHTCLFQYTFKHLVGYKDMTFDQLKTYHSTRPDSLCPGHPEIEHDGIEVTTGPLGQGIANAVGLAMATKNLAATYNKPGYDVVSNHTWCMTGDACLQEGVALESIQLAGHWKLNNMTLIYDNNQISCDGSIDMVNTEDINTKMQACGWDVIDVMNGSYDVEAIFEALEKARSSEKPTFINIRTIIGVGAGIAGTAQAHGVAFGVEAVAQLKKSLGRDPEEHFIVPEEVYEFFREVVPRGQKYEQDWYALVDKYAAAHPELAAEFDRRREGKMTQDWTKLIPTKDQLPTKPTPSRKSSGLVCSPLAAALNNFMVGTADLSPSVNLFYPERIDFQNVSAMPALPPRTILICQKPELKTSSGPNGTYAGRYIHYGIREHAMCAIANGLAAYNPGTFLPVTSSFFMFYIYAAAGVRMGALQHLQAIHVATHDSIGTGEDGPTHQPIALAALFRAMPNLLYIRPCDSEEVAGAYIAAINAIKTPSMISLSRQNLEQYPQHSKRGGVQKGAYVFIEENNADVTLIGVGAEMCFAVKAREELANHGIRARIISFPCQRLFERQTKDYRKSVLGKAPRVVIEGYSVTGWERYADAGFNMASFGKSLPGTAVYDFFGFESRNIADKVRGLLDDIKQEGIESLRGDFRDLNGTLR